MDPLPRIIDANANRAMEALRTLEDLVRFALEDRPLAAGLKTLRHDLAAALARFPAGWLIANRSTATDVGTSNATESEYRRDGLGAIASAAASRLGESLRAIEECAKSVDPTVAVEVERLRYRSYDFAAAVVGRLPGAATQWRVCVLLTESLCRRPWREVLLECIDAGVDAIQVREKSLEAGPFAERVAWIVERARAANVRTIVNDRPDIALICGADGVHCGQQDLSPSQVRQLCGRRLLVGMSTHDAAEAERAMAEGADYCGVGAMYATSVKPGAAQVGLPWLRAYLARFGRVPHLAIGGITPENIGALVEAGCRGVAVSGCVCGAERPGAIVRTLQAAFR